MEITTFSATEIQQFRSETKGTAVRVHFNNAGASLPPDIVPATVIGYLNEEAVYGGYETEAKYAKDLDRVYASIARLINADPSEVAVVENASLGWWISFNGIDFKKGDVILTSEMEYVTNLISFLHVAKRYGVEIKVIPNDEQGNFDLAALEAAISPQTKLIAITYIASSTGGMMPVIEIGRIARKHDVLYLVDGCQAVGHVPLDVKEIGCDMMSVTGRKYLRGPRGTGFFYVRKAVVDRLTPVFMDGFSTEWISENDFKIRGDARRFELFESSKAAKLGLGKAVDYALTIGVDRIWLRIQELSTELRRRLKAFPGITVEDLGAKQCGIVTFTVKGLEADEVKTRLAEKNINVSVGLAKSTLLFMNKHQLASVVRASVHYYNTEEEIRILCDAVTEIAEGR